MIHLALVEGVVAVALVAVVLVVALVADVVAVVLAVAVVVVAVLLVEQWNQMHLIPIFSLPGQYQPRRLEAGRPAMVVQVPQCAAAAVAGPIGRAVQGGRESRAIRSLCLAHRCSVAGGSPASLR